MTTRVYCDGALTKKMLAAKLDDGLVLVGQVRNGWSGGDVACFRKGTEAEIADCRSRILGDAIIVERVDRWFRGALCIEFKPGDIGYPNTPMTRLYRSQVLEGLGVVEADSSDG